MHPLAQKLSSLKRRLVMRQRATAMCWIVTIVLAAAITLGALDYTVRFADPGLRIMATFALVSAATWAVYRWWYSPGRHYPTQLAVARHVERHFPQLRDILASSTEFLEQSEDDSTAGSAQLRRSVVAEAESAVAQLPLDDVVDRRPLRRALWWLAIPITLLLLCLVWDGGAVGTALVRLVAPLGSTQWPRANHLAFRDVPTRLAVGQTFEVELIDTADKLPDDVRIEYRMADRNRRESSSEPMMRSGDVMLARRENVRESFAFRAVGGDDHTMPWHRVDVVEPPKLEEFSVVAHPPAYAGLPPSSAEGHLEVLAGSGLEIRGVASEALSEARVVMDGSQPIPATIGAGSAGKDRREFHIAQDSWIASDSGTYRVELSDADGVASVVGQWSLRVRPDPPPSVSWTRPSEDMFITADAIVSIAVSVTDNLAIKSIDLVCVPVGTQNEAESNKSLGNSTESRIEIYRGPAKAVANESGAVVDRGETRTVEYRWNLTPLQLPVGTELVCHIEAADYRPGTGRTAAPRRIAIISKDELDARLAQHQLQILKQLERALSAQQTTRAEVRRLEIQPLKPRDISTGDHVALQTAEMNQRQVRNSLVAPKGGVIGSVHALLDEIEINQVSASDVREAMEHLLVELNRLSGGPLTFAESNLVAAGKAVGEVESTSIDTGQSSRPLDAAIAQRVPSLLAATGTAQDEVIARLERLIRELSGSTDARQLAQQLIELRRDQMQHEQIVRTDIGLETLPLQQNELSRAQRASLEKAAVGQSALARRFESIVQAIDQVARQQSTQDSAATQAADLARRLAIATNMQETSQDLSHNRVGQALTRASQIAADLEQVLEALRGGSARRPDRLVGQIREAEERLARLRERVAALRQQVAQHEQPPDRSAKTRQSSQLASMQQELQRETEQLAEQLQRLQVNDASASTQQAARRLASQVESNEPAKPARPAPSGEVQQAEKDLEQAAQQLAEARQQQENNLAQELVRRFQAELSTMVERQKSVIHDTARLDVDRHADISQSDSVEQIVAKLADEERKLSQLAGEHGELLSGLGAVRLGLAQAQRRLASAASQLDRGDTGAQAQQAERFALSRLEDMQDAFAQTASESAPNRNAPAGNNGNPSGEQTQRRPTFELLEAKMLRMLQVDLNERTQAMDDRMAGLNEPLQDGERAELAQLAKELQAEQGRLAKLVQEMMTRDNGGAE